MASTGSGRGPIKVGSGYIDVFPKLNQKALQETKAQLEKQMAQAGTSAGKAFSKGLTTELAGVPKKAAEVSRKAQKEIEKSALDSKKVLKAIEQEITKDYGAEAGKRFREAAELEQRKQKLLDQTSAATRRALQATLREEQQAARNAARAWETAERERIRLIQEREREAERAAREQAAAERRAQQQMRDDIRRTLTEARAARLQDLQHQLDAQRDQAAALRNSLRDYRRQMDDHVSAVGRGLTSIQTAWRRQGESIEKLGTNITETGRLITMHLLGPLGAVSSLLTTIGVQSADMRILGQLGLSAAGVSKSTSAAEMRRIQQYAIATPYSIDTMHEYQMKLIRSIAGNDKQWYNDKTKTAAANRAAAKASDIIMAVGDTMARAGNLDESMFERAMYAVDRIMDMDKAPTRNINQLVQATGIPAGELAQMFGFSSAGAFWKQVGTPVAKGGGISGQDMINNLLRFWDPNYFVMDPKTGKPKIDPKTGQPIVNTGSHSTAGGSIGYGERMTAATISGRIQQIKEQAQYTLGSLFARENPKTHEYEYTALGEAIMGKRVPVYTRDEKGELTETGRYTYEGGLLQKVQQLGSGQRDNIVGLLKTAFDALNTFVDQIQAISDFIEEHPEIKKAFASIIKMGATIMPWVLAIGVSTKVIGKLNKMLSSALTPLGAVFKGIRGGIRGLRQVGAGVQSARAGDGFLQGYRSRRTELRGGDVRGPVARVRDRITGQDSGRGQLTRQIRETEDAIRDTEARITDLQRQIREVSRTSIRSLVDQFAGSSASGSGSLQYAAQGAARSVDDIRDQLQQLDRQSLGSVSREVSSLKEKIDDLTKEIRASKEAIGDLDGKKLTALKVQVDSAHGTVIDLKNKIDDTSHSVNSLNSRKLSDLQAQAADTTNAVGKLIAKIRDAISRVNDLNGRKLSAVRGEFHGSKASLYNAVNDVYKLVGTAKSGLTGRITTLNGRSLASIIKRVKDLGAALDTSGKHAKTLNDRLNDIANHAIGKSSGGSSSGSKKTRKASGGVLPGYTPGRDVHTFISPTAGELHLSGGEAVMRPEWTAAVGPEFVTRMNSIARTKGVPGVRRAMRLARGGIIDEWGLGSLIDMARTFDISRDVLGASATMVMDSGSRTLGGDVHTGVVGAGTDGSHFIGSDIAGRFEGIYNFISRDTWNFLKKAPVPDGVSQVLGAVVGAISPIAGDYFWDDVWKGHGNILERGGRFLSDLISAKTAKQVIGNLLGGLWDSVKSLWNGGKALLTDPIGTVKDALSGVWDLMSAEYDGLIDMVKSLGQIWASPKDYAKQVISDIYSTAKEALPNLDGLFDFSGDHLSVKQPDIDAVLAAQFSTPGLGSAVTRWTPQVKMALAQLGLSQEYVPLVLHRIQVESGGNPNAINLWDINAKLGHPSQGLMQTIPSTFNAYAGPYKPLGILNPLANIYAGLNYAVHRYGSGWTKALSGIRGYATGTLSASPGLALVGERGPELVAFRGGERVYSNRETETLVGNGRVVNLTINEAKHETTPQAVLRGLQWVDSMYGNRL